MVTIVSYLPAPLCAIFGLSTAHGQTIYYVSTAGNDGNSGRSGDTPFQTIARVNSLLLQPGDQVLFRRGDTFRGSLKLRQSGSAPRPIVIDAYGSGSKPVLSGSMPVTSWSRLGNNLWQASCVSCGDQVTGLYRNNATLPLGRYPNPDAANKGYLTVQTHTGKTQLVSQQSLATNWQGGEAVFRPVQWILNRARITGQTGNTLNLDGSGSYDITNNWGYFVQNHPATLDQPGEWYYNPANKTILLYDNQANPNDQLITATVYAEVIQLTDVSYVSIRNLQIKQALSTNMLATNSSNLAVTNTDISQSGEDGLVIRGNGNQLLIENNSIEDINNNGVNIGNYQNVTVRGNTIRRIGLVPGRGKSGDGTYVGFQSTSTATTVIENNVLDNIGYNALNFASNTVVQRNQISNFCATKSDGSGLYIWNGNKQPQSNIKLVSNIIFNGIGALEGTPAGTSSSAHGIYLDDCTTNIDVSDNTVYNCRGLGIYLHGSSNINVSGNTACNNGEGQLAIMSANGCQPRTNTIRNNILVSLPANQFDVKYESYQDDLGSYGQFDNNVYARPFSGPNKILAVYNRTVGAAYSLSQWQGRYGKDMTSTVCPISYPSGNPDDYIKCFVNPTANPTTITLNGGYRDVRNKAHRNQVTLPAFGSIILLKDSDQAPATLREADNPANAVAGLDYSYYEGSWANLPDFKTLNPVKSGVVQQPDLQARSRDDNFAFRFTGFITVPADGTYTFFTNSDDGSKLYIGNTEVVNNDGGHAVQERSGTIGLKAGRHAFTLTYMEGGGNQSLQASYSGPGLSKQIIPAASFWRVSTGNGSPVPVAIGSGTGLRADYFNTKNLNGPIVLTRTDASINMDWGGTSPAPGKVNTDNFSIRWTGRVQAPATGIYLFKTYTDDGIRVWVNGTLLINDWNDHPPTTNKGLPITLVGGQLYDIRVEYSENVGGALAKFYWSYPGQTEQIVPQHRLYPAVSNGRLAVETTEWRDELGMQVYPTPAQRIVQLRYYAEAAGEATIELVSMRAQSVLQANYPVTAGNNLIPLAVEHLMRGPYILVLSRGTDRQTCKVLLTD